MPLIQGDLEKAGIKVELLATDNATYLKELNARKSGTASSPSVAVRRCRRRSRSSTSRRLRTAPRCSPATPTRRSSNSGQLALSTTDEAAQDAAYHELAKILNDDVPQVNLWADDLIQAYSKKLGGGFKIHVNERETFMNVETWTLSQ